MKDETYVFISDVKEKGSIGRSARHRKTHNGKGGRVRLPSDNLSKEEPEAYVEENVPCIRLDEEVEKVNEKMEWLMKENDRLKMNVRILEAQMEVVRLIFGGNRNGT